MCAVEIRINSTCHIRLCPAYMYIPYPPA